MKKNDDNNNDWLITKASSRSKKWIHSFVEIDISIELNESIHHQLSESIIPLPTWPWNRGQWVWMMQVVPRSSNNIECVFIWYVAWSSMETEEICLSIPSTHGSLCEDEREDFKERWLGQKRVRHFFHLCFIWTLIFLQQYMYQHRSSLRFSPVDH